jgi:hypothetical protein
MAIQRIPGSMLESNLVREGVDLAFQTNLLYLDVNNNRLGVGTDAPGYTLDVNGLANFRNDVTITGDLTVNGTTTTVDSQNLVVEDNLLLINSNNSAATDAGIMINRGGANDPAVLYWDESLDVFRVGTTTSDGSTRQDLTGVTLAKIQAADPVGDDDLVTKRYFTANASSIADGQALPLGTPGDFDDTNSNTVETSFTDGAYTQIGSADSVTEAIAALNETMENIREGTYVQTVDFTADVTTGSAGLVVTLTITHVGGGADRYNIDWGDGNVTTATTDSTPTHTYSSNVGSPFDVTVRAYASGAVTNSAGSFATKTRSSYIVIYTAAPATNFFIYAASSGGSAITKTDSGSTIYLENTSTNTTSATVTYEVDWGDGNSDTIASDSAAGGVSGSRLAHTYTNSAADDGSTVAGTGAGDTRYRIRLTLLTHSTADPAEIPKSTDKNFDVYSLHTPKIDIADSTLRGINEQSTSGFPVTFINGTDTNPGSQSVFTSNIYSWDFGEGASATNVNVGSGGTGDTGQTIANTFNLSSGEQAAGTTQTYNVQLSLATGHSTTPFQSAITQIVVEPDVRANIAGTAVTVSTGSGDNQYTLYDTTDLDGNVRSLTRFTNTSQNADDYFYDYYDDSSSTALVTEDGASAGSIAATIDKDYTGASNGNINFRFRAHGTPDTIEQDDEETITWTMKAVPAAPANLSTKSITLADSAQGTSPKLCAGFDDNTSSFTSQTAGDSLNTTTARRYTTTTTIDTSVASNFYNGASGTLSAAINASADGSKAFTTAEGETGTFTSLVVTSNVDYDTVVGTYPQRLYLVASAKITKNLSGYTVGSNAQRLEHTATGNTNLVYVVKDDITATPTTTIGTVAEGTAGTYEYVSGIPYYDSGSPTVTVTGTTVSNFTGQAYADISDPHEIDPGTVSEGSGSIISNIDYTYANVDGASSMLTGGIPNVDTGVSSAYTLGTLTVPLTGSSMFSVSTIKARSANCNGDGSYSEDSTKIQVFTATPGGLNKDQGGIIVSDSLGVTYDDDAVRISGLGSASDTPSFSNADYYTNNAWNGAVTVAGTQEAIVRPTGTSAGTIQHDTTDYSSGYLPVGPDRSSDTGAQYYTFAFRRANVANFTVTLTGTVSGFYIAAPGTQIDSTSTLNGWIDASIAYAGSGVPGANTGAGGNGSNGCAFTSGDRIIDGTTYSAQSFTLTLGSENASNATGNNILVRIKLESGDSVTALSIA